MALHALELEDGGGPESTLFVRLRGIVRHGFEATELGGDGLNCPEAEGEVGAGEVVVGDPAVAFDAPLGGPGVADEDLLSCIKSCLLYQCII